MQASWITVGGDSYRTNLAYVTVPSPTTTVSDSCAVPANLPKPNPRVLFLDVTCASLGPHGFSHSLSIVQGVELAFVIPAPTTANPNANTTILPPLVNSFKAGPVTILGNANNCTVTFYDTNYNVLGAWSGCARGATISAPLSLDAAGQTVAVLSSDGSIYFVDARLPTVGNLLSTSQIPYPSVLAPLLVADNLWVTGVHGFMYIISLTTGRYIELRSFECMGRPDTITSSPTLLDAFRITLVATTSRGCTVAVDGYGALLWNATLPANTTGNFSLPLNPAVDVTNHQVYVGTQDGTVCCLSAAQGTACAMWEGGCIKLPTAALPVTAMAIGPDNQAFHSGQVFILDATGLLLVVSAETGIVFTSEGSITLPPVSTAPIVVPNALGADINVMIVVSTNGDVNVVYVGDGPVSACDDPTDDPSDDDSTGNAGVAWTFSLSSALATWSDGGAANARSPAVNVAGIAVRDDGRIIIPLQDGRVVVLGPQHPAPPAPTDTVVIIVISVVVAVCVAGIAVTVWCGCRHKWRRVPVFQPLDDGDSYSRMSSDAQGYNYPLAAGDGASIDTKHSMASSINRSGV